MYINYLHVHCIVLVNLNTLSGTHEQRTLETGILYLHQNGHHVSTNNDTVYNVTIWTPYSKYMCASKAHEI